MPPAARITDLHICPLINPDGSPHVGGLITGPGVPMVLIGGQPAAVATDLAICIGPPDSLLVGSSSVLIGGKPAVRMGDTTAHGGTVSGGLATVLIGG